ncbi:oligosaccharide flippase family protein [Empedobacter sp.]|uniref:lipopolysaccharide biosynthesis protein n=1 Tax=Empedobacter sp. TaxID=1927715 RepID=UPI0028A6FE96|nr:oligosaccharide flippase family protein [Empedobacter sp.]
MIKLLKTNRFIKGTFLYTIFDILSKAIPFILLPVITRYLSTQDFGTLTNFSVVMQISTMLCGFSTYSFLSISYFKLAKNELSKYYSNLSYIIILISILLISLSYIFQNHFQTYLGINFQYQFFGIITGTSIAIFTLYSTLLRMENKIISFGIWQVINSLIIAVLAILFVVFYNWGWKGRAISFFLGNILTVFVLIYILYKSRILFKKLELSKIKEIFSFGLPLVPHTLSFWFKSGMDKLIITTLIGLSANGVYSIALTLASLIGVFTNSFFGAFSPILFENLTIIERSTDIKQINSIKEKLVRYTVIYLIILFCVCILSFYIMKFLIPIFFIGDYVKSLNYLPVIFCTLFFEGIYSIMSGYIFFRKKTKTLGIITFSSSVLQMLLTFLLVRKFGLIGAAYSGLIIAILTSFLVFYVSQNMYKFKWNKVIKL